MRGFEQATSGDDVVGKECRRGTFHGRRDVAQGLEVLQVLPCQVVQLSTHDFQPGGRPGTNGTSERIDIAGGACQAADGVSLLQQHADNPPSQKTGSTGHDDLHVLAAIAGALPARYLCTANARVGPTGASSSWGSRHAANMRSMMSVTRQISRYEMGGQVSSRMAR